MKRNDIGGHQAMTVPVPSETMLERATQQQSNPFKRLWQSLPWVASGVALTVSLVALATVGTSHPYGQNGLIPNHQGQPPYTLSASAKLGDERLFSNSTNIIADVAEAIAPSVVNIDVAKRNKVSQMMPFMMDQDVFERFFGIRPMPMPQGSPQAPMMKGNGSGVVLSADGHILTNNHVVNGADEITVTFKDGRKLKARIVGKDPLTDIAVLKVDGATNLKPAKLGDSAHLRPGEWVIAVGSPLGFDHTVTLGIVSALSRQVPDLNSNVEFIQTDAAINPGNSGGPLVNLNGEVIGINTAIAGTGQNIGFAIPVNSVKAITKDLVTTGSVTRPWIGITMSELSPGLAQSLGLPANTSGVVVAQVFPNSPSAHAGFQEGDIIQRINGEKMASAKAIQDLIRSKPLNTQLNVQILRNGQMQALMLRTEILPASAFNAPQ